MILEPKKICVNLRQSAVDSESRPNFSRVFPFMPRPKVCHIIHNDGPGGGPVVIVDQLAATGGDFELSVIHGGRGKVADYCEGAGIPHWQVAIDRKTTVPLGFFQLIAALRRASPDLAILHGQWAGPVSAAALRVAGVRRSIYIAGWPAFYTDWDLWRVIRNRLSEAIPCHWCDRVVVLSQGNWYQYSLRRLGAGKLRLIHNGVDLSRVPSPHQVRSVRETHGWDDRHCHVVSVGRLADQKCLDWLLRSWRIVQERHPDARLWIVGSGPEEPALHRLAKELDIAGTCAFLGSRPNGFDYVAASDIVAMTSLYEGHALLPLEAMAAARPIVASDVDGVRDSIRDGAEGFLVPPAEIEAFAQKLLSLIGDPVLRKKMGEAGRLRAPEFSIARASREFSVLIAEVLAL
jgi:glycosyltransferase involved in cell wall biosynthesis